MIKTKQELLNHFSDINEMYNNPFKYQTLSNMIDELLEQQPCEDCISREELINELKLGYFNKDLQEGKNDPCVIDAMIDWAIRTVKQLPPVTPSIPDVENDFNLGYNCGYADAMCDIGGEE